MKRTLGRFQQLPAFAILSLAALAVAAGVFEAASTIVDQNGDLLTVDVYGDPSDPSSQGLRLAFHMPTGQISYETVPDTMDPIEDIDASLAVNPGDGIVVVWSRRTGGSDLELVLGRRTSTGSWAPNAVLTGLPGNDAASRVVVDQAGTAHIVWWGNGPGGPFYLQEFSVDSGQALGSLYRPLEPPASRRLSTSVEDGDLAGGSNDPAVPTKDNKASAYPCLENPDAAPEHGVLMSCGRAVAYQLSSCYLVVAMQDPASGSYAQTYLNLSSTDLSTVSVRQLVESVANARCQQ